VARLDDAGPFLETKLRVPGGPRRIVARQRLAERLRRGTESKLTLLSAPPGFGKTTLLAAWLAETAGDRRSTAWLSLDAGDSRPASFWSHVIAALQAVVPGIGETSRSLLREPQPPPVETILAPLLNELGGVPTDIVLVLDDYHLVDAADIGMGMAFLLEHLPPRAHLVIAARADPGLPLGRLRARGELVEIRAADLRFTPDEAAAYLNEVMELELVAGDVAALEDRTEGWIAALQLAALSIRGRADVAGFIAGFAGDDRYIVDYLAEEVLQRQPAHVRRFLLQTSILGRLSGPLCDAVTGEDGSRAILDTLDRGNLFVVPLDDRRQWYRYHQLFADVLRAHLADEQPDVVALLHRRASEWYAQTGEQAEAIRHALAAEDPERVGDLIERAVPALLRDRQDATVRGWLEALPVHMLTQRPVLSVLYAAVLLAGGELEGVERRLDDAERWLTATGVGSHDGSATGPPGMIVADHDQLRSLPASIAVYRAVLAQIHGDRAATVRYARTVLDVAAEDDDLRRGAAMALLGLASWAGGDLEAAHRIYADGMARVQRAGSLSDAIGAAIALADIRLTQGRLRDALRTYEAALGLATQEGKPVVRAGADMHVGLADVLREQGELQAATGHLQASRALGEHVGFPHNRYRWHVVTARILEAAGDLDGALDALAEARRVAIPDFNPDVQPISARVARVLARQGRLAEATAWARERGLSVDDELTYLREFEHVTLARVLLAQTGADPAGGAAREAVALLDRLLRAAEDGQRMGSVMEILVLQALAHRASHANAAAMGCLERALALAEPEGYVRMFLDEGAPMVALLKTVATGRPASAYVRSLLAASGGPTGRAILGPDLVEPPSERELDVLRLLATDLSGPDIARELVLSLNTVRSHTKSIYAKLGVNNRRAAVRRAEELDLLSRAARP
jgi:LuxR family maltose regulon positive regulatory protein